MSKALIGGLVLFVVLSIGLVAALRMNWTPSSSAAVGPTGWHVVPAPPVPGTTPPPYVAPKTKPLEPDRSLPRITIEAALKVAAEMRLSALSGMDGGFDAYWDFCAESQAWRSQLQSSSYKHIWPYFFSGTLLIPGPDADPQVVAFYNPYADAALLTAWSRLPNGDRISNAAVVLGSELRGGRQTSTTGLPRWCQQDGPLADRLLRSLADFRKDFPGVSSGLLTTNGGARSVGQNLSLRQIEQRCLALSVELARLCATRSSEPIAAAVGDLMRILGSGSVEGIPTAATPTAARLEIQALGSQRLARMRPAFAAQFSDGSLVLLMDPREPTTLLAAHFTGASPAPKLLALSPCRYR